jgi:hypothetical protein
MNLISIASKGYFGLEAGGFAQPVFILPPEIASTVVITDLSGVVLKPKLGGEDASTKPSMAVDDLNPGLNLDELKPKIEVGE